MNTVMGLGAVFASPDIPDLRDLSFQIYSVLVEGKKRALAPACTAPAPVAAPVAEPAVEDTVR